MQEPHEQLQSVQSKVALYDLFAQALNYPEQALIERLVDGGFADVLRASMAGAGHALPETYLDRLKSEYSVDLRDKSEMLLELEKEYTRIFFSSKPRLAYLFESVYNEGKLYQDSTFEIAGLYHDAGLKISDEFRLPPDHIAVEFEFLSFLCFKELEGAGNGDKETREYAKELQAEVLDRHLRPFALNVAERLDMHARTVFHATVAAAILQHFRPS